ncbi:MAG TPA: phage major capsid protein [Candidatus Dormibacteraeota bacterium]|jgi:HK97 family phage major capsid protein|nr:phage major capsid protein [Candidatus Dormibacteraeota bacterium]
MDAIKRLREQRAALWSRMQEMLTQAETRDGGLSGELKESWDKAEADMTRIDGELTARKVAADIEARLNAPRTDGPGVETAVTTTGTDARAEEYRTAFRSWMARGAGDMTPEDRAVLQAGYVEHRDLGVGSGSIGGFTVPQGFLTKITETQKLYAVLRSVANVITTTTGNALPWPGNDDTSNVGELLAENSTVGNQDVVFTQNTLNAYVYTSKSVQVPLTLLNDSAFDIDSWLGKKFGQRLGRIQATHHTTGTGTNQPQGIVTGMTQGNTLAVGNTTTVPYAGLVQLMHAIDPAYRLNASWMLSDGALQTLRTLVDAQNRPLWQPAITGSDPDTILGRPYTLNPALAAPAANAKPVLFGDWSQYYIVRDVEGTQMVRLAERYMDKLQVGFFAFQRNDARVDDVKAAAYMQNSAT